jgi:DNA-directed RNA polymerase specialized sigma24 family protein
MPTPFDTDREDAERGPVGADMAGAGVSHWFIREVLPLEAALMQFLRRSLSNASDADDLCQDVYVRVYQAALEKIPNPAKPFVFTVARNLPPAQSRAPRSRRLNRGGCRSRSTQHREGRTRHGPLGHRARGIAQA